MNWRSWKFWLLILLLAVVLVIAGPWLCELFASFFSWLAGEIPGH